jgi:predicted ATPase
MASTAFLQRVRLKNYRSIGACDVALGPLTFFVGPNGSGKSNFVDALRFVSDSLNQSLDHAIRNRGGIDEVRRRSGGHPNNFGISFWFRNESLSGHYAFEVSAAPSGAWTVKRELCHVQPAADVFGGVLFEVRGGDVVQFPTDLGKSPPAAADRLFLTNASGYPPFRVVFDALSRMGFYNLNPDAMRRLQPPDSGDLLKRDGSNVASVLARLESHADRKDQLIQYLSRVVPGVTDIAHKALGPAETVEFRQKVQGAREPWRFTAINMSDGTLRALGVLLALLQNGNGSPIPLVGIEEPETALHPAAAGALLDALRDAATRMQVIVTSHSADLLEDKDVLDDQILAVVAEGNTTEIGPVNKVAREALHERLYTAGDLLRMNRLVPETNGTSRRQLDLFAAPEQ